jgi:hypothetical protein
LRVKKTTASETAIMIFVRFPLRLKSPRKIAAKARTAKMMGKTGRANESSSEEEKVADYIQNGLKFPLPKNRIGELTAPLESFFNVSHIDYYVNAKKRKLKNK